jgi:hypothetical protein
VNKFISAILFSIFLLVQVGPAVQGLINGNASLLIMDEDKSPDKSESETKKITSIQHGLYELAIIGGHIQTAFHCSERLHASPFLEIPGLPPDIC